MRTVGTTGKVSSGGQFNDDDRFASAPAMYLYVPITVNAVWIVFNAHITATWEREYATRLTH